MARRCELEDGQVESRHLHCDLYNRLGAAAGVKREVAGLQDQIAALCDHLGVKMVWRTGRNAVEKISGG